MEKTKYFTEYNLKNKSNTWLKKLDKEINLHSDRIHISKSTLLILDMQDFFHDENSHAFIPSAQAIISPIIQLASIFNEHNRPIILTKHINTSENAKMMDYWWREILTEDSKYSKLITEVEKIQNTDLIVKSQYDAYHKTMLNEILQKDNVEQVVITGVMTHLCCETTARSAFVHGYNVFFPIDGTATYNKRIHKSSLLNLAHGFANITTISNLIEMINE